MLIFKLKTKIQVKENRDNTRKRFYLCPSQVFFSKILDKKQEIFEQKVEIFPLKSYTVRAEWPV